MQVFVIAISHQELTKNFREMRHIRPRHGPKLNHKNGCIGIRLLDIIQDDPSMLVVPVMNDVLQQIRICNRNSLQKVGSLCTEV